MLRSLVNGGCWSIPVTWAHLRLIFLGQPKALAFPHQLLTSVHWNLNFQIQGFSTKTLDLQLLCITLRLTAINERFIHNNYPCICLMSPSKIFSPFFFCPKQWLQDQEGVCLLGFHCTSTWSPKKKACDSWSFMNGRRLIPSKAQQFTFVPLN